MGEAARQVSARLLAAALAAPCLLLAAPGCYSFGGPPDKTFFRRLPEDTPPDQWLRRDLAVHARFEGVFVGHGEQEATRDDPASNSYSRLLRKAGVFLSVDGPDVAAAPPQSASTAGAGGRVRMQVRYRADSHTSSNLAKAAIAPGLTGYRFGLESTMELRVWLDGEDEPIRYEATTALVRLYHHAGSHDAAHRMLYDEVDRRNFLAIVHAMRADPRLHRPEDALQPL